ncbi:hypothetical protein H696_05615 [Fonticula alba]|uniref:Uncharacterized protein n=1 Tax=Fonticula alba TaxID=691883 RepID=A0A058Z175_FONAL|nr:hypothetical protein H696_05615 [Fonticula alba]KCV67886.1 hypothetical protein H696_05615 [Fonticula alba]|eukprot:XP_009497706.1 hypothetical protein H696_05615 [Fonticula alba]
MLRGAVRPLFQRYALAARAGPALLLAGARGAASIATPGVASTATPGVASTATSGAAAPLSDASPAERLAALQARAQHQLSVTDGHGPMRLDRFLRAAGPAAGRPGALPNALFQRLIRKKQIPLF